VRIYDSIPTSNEEIINRIGDADAVLLSWNTKLSKEVIAKLKNLKYIGMCCSLIDESSANVDIQAAKSQGIQVFGVRDYGDEGVVEYIFSEIIRLVKGIGSHKLYTENTEIGSLTMGIVGMGTLGLMVAEMAENFNMKVLYYSRMRKPELETENIQYSDLSTLAQKSDIISFHLPRNVRLFTQDYFDSMKRNSVIINTSLSLPFHKNEFEAWLKSDNHFAILDGVGVEGNYDRFLQFPRAIITQLVTGWTVQAKERLAKKAIENIERYMKKR
jgi:phosphoglycerate dehydrogenase-like enzyme